MNRQNNLLRILKIAVYLALLIISTWATVESLHMLLPSIPIVVLWVLSAILYFVASLGTKMIFRSFNHNERIDGRFKMLIGGILLVLFFWVGLILPTNTHTFFYNSVIKNTSLQELTNTSKNLLSLSTTGHTIIESEKQAFEGKVKTDIDSWASEILNAGDPGSGVRAETILQRISTQIGDIQRLTLKSKRQADLIIFRDQMVSQMRSKLKIKSDEIYDARLKNYDATINQNELKSLQNRIADEIDFVKSTGKVRSKAKDVLLESDAIIDKYTEILQKTGFKNSSLIQGTATPKIIELENVVQVWKNFFRGEYKQQGFVFWILLAFLIDVAGFIFYSIAFKKNENY